jgi:hypothetical protein
MGIGHEHVRSSFRGGRHTPLRGLALLAVPLLVLAACNDDDPVEPPPTEYQWTTTLAGTEGWEQITGEASAQWTEGGLQFQSSASISGDEPDAVRPWHVHFNTCAEGGGIVGVDGDYPRLEVDEDGNASASATVPMPLDPTQDYHVNVHLSDEELETIIACGDMTLVGNGTP